jgi:putative tricarboxylic transport membrane protein
MMADRVIFVCTIIVAAVYLYATTLIPSLEIGDPLGPKAFPRLLGIALLLSAGFLFLEIWRDRKTPPPPAPLPSSMADYSMRPVSPPAGAAGEWPLGIVLVIAGVAIWTAGYYLVFQPLGFIIATATYLLGLMAWFNRGKWLANVLSAVLFALFSYIMFVKLDVNLPRGAAAFSWLADGVHAVLDAITSVFRSTK